MKLAFYGYYETIVIISFMKLLSISFLSRHDFELTEGSKYSLSPPK